MKVIRRNVFETNSSSTHSICVTKNDILDQKQNRVEFDFGEFGWEYNTLITVHGKASYLYTGIMSFDSSEINLIKLKEILDKNNIKYVFSKSANKEYFDSGYIDHYGDLINFLKILDDEDKTMRFLFSSESFIITGNDNNDKDVGIKVSYDYDEYYKGN